MEENRQRTEDGRQTLLDHMEKIEEAAKLFLASLKGFRRDLSLSADSYPKSIEAEFAGVASAIAVPPLRTGESFSSLVQMLLLAEDAIDGKITVMFPPAYKQEETKKVLEEIEITHKNLLAVSDAAHQMGELIRTACLEFDMFNTKNIEVGYPEANIVFNRDSLNVAMATARALGERAVRLDIDLVGKRDSI